MTHPLCSPEGREALAEADAQADPGSLSAASVLRARFSPEVASAALGQSELRRRAVLKLGERARRMLFTRDGLEQATREPVARWRAERLVSAGVTHVLDLGCGIAADALALADAGLRVTAVEIDRETAELARHNLALAGAGHEVLVGDATQMVEGLPTAENAAVFLDPARRTARGRTWRLDDLTPSWSFVLEVIESGRPVVVKLGPGIDRDVLPPVAVTHVSHVGDAVETTLWSGLEAPANEAVLIGPEGVTGLAGEPTSVPLGPLGRFLHEPDPAVSRAELVGRLGLGLAQLDVHAGYFSSDEPLAEPFATSFEVLDVLDARPKSLARWVASEGIGALEIKKRGRGGALDVDPAALRRQLKPAGPHGATLVLARVEGQVRALHVRRLAST